MSEPIGPVWTSPETWVDPSCIECGGSGAPCCDPPDHPYPTDPVTLVYVEAVAKMGPLVGALFDERDRLRAQRDAVLKRVRSVERSWAGSTPPNTFTALPGVLYLSEIIELLRTDNLDGATP